MKQKEERKRLPWGQPSNLAKAISAEIITHSQKFYGSLIMMSVKKEGVTHLPYGVQPLI